MWHQKNKNPASSKNLHHLCLCYSKPVRIIVNIDKLTKLFKILVCTKLQSCPKKKKKLSLVNNSLVYSLIFGSTIQNSLIFFIIILLTYKLLKTPFTKTTLYRYQYVINIYVYIYVFQFNVTKRYNFFMHFLYMIKKIIFYDVSLFPLKSAFLKFY